MKLSSKCQYIFRKLVWSPSWIQVRTSRCVQRRWERRACFIRSKARWFHNIHRTYNDVWFINLYQGLSGFSVYVPRENLLLNCHIGDKGGTYSSLDARGRMYVIYKTFYQWKMKYNKHFLLLSAILQHLVAVFSCDFICHFCRLYATSFSLLSSSSFCFISLHVSA
jgi:hypothetical protein